jgi:hypothetical protein
MMRLARRCEAMARQQQHRARVHGEATAEPSGRRVHGEAAAASGAGFMASRWSQLAVVGQQQQRARG